MSYTIPAQTHIGHVHLKVADINRALTFYKDLLGFEITQYYGESAVFISAGGYQNIIESELLRFLLLLISKFSRCY